MNNFQYQMLAYNLLSQQQQQQQQSTGTATTSGASTPAYNTNTTVAQAKDDPMSISPAETSSPQQNNTTVATVKPVEEAPKTMAERLVEAIYQQSIDFIAFRKNANLSNPLPPFNQPEHISNSNKLTALELLSGHQRSHAHASRQQRLLLPDTAPHGLDPYTILQEREKRIEDRVSIRLAELEATMDDEDQRQPLGYLLNEYYDDTVKTASPQRLRSIVQLRSLQLRDKQTKVNRFNCRYTVDTNLQ